MTSGHHIDGALASWDEVVDEREWEVLLLGNGLSINVWPEFAYGSLFDRAAAGGPHGGLAPADKELFAALGGTTNFERVLADLRASIRAAGALGVDATPFEARYDSIRTALGAAVRASHVEQIEIPESTFRTINESLRAFEWVFTTSYDLIGYWAMGVDRFAGFCDCFWANGRNEFDAGWAEIDEGVTPVFFAHGALHLVVEADGTTRKLRRDNRSLLEQFAQQVPGEPEARPLLITEGSSQDKLAAIEQNDYLSYVLQHLRECHEPLVVFGHSLSEQDAHLADAINVHPTRAVAVSMLPGERVEVRERQAEIRARLRSEELYFFDASTHPLGDPGLRTFAGSARGLAV